MLGRQGDSAAKLITPACSRVEATTAHLGRQRGTPEGHPLALRGITGTPLARQRGGKPRWRDCDLDNGDPAAARQAVDQLREHLHNH
jgi:hypothetical protein